MVERISAWQRSVRRKRRTRRGCRTMPFRERCRERAGPGRDVPWPLPAALALQKCYHAETRGPCIHAPSLRRVDDCRTGIVHPARWPDSLPMSRPRNAGFRPARRMAILRRCALTARDALAPLRARARRRRLRVRRADRRPSLDPFRHSSSAASENSGRDPTEIRSAYAANASMRPISSRVAGV